MEKLVYSSDQLKEIYAKLFDAFRYSLQHFNVYQFEKEYNNFIGKLVAIVDNFKLYNFDKDYDFIILLDNLEYIILHLENAYQLFHIAQGTLDDVIDKEFPMLVEKFEVFSHENKI